MSAAGQTAMSSAEVFVCPITIWEITRKIATGKLEPPSPPRFAGSIAAWLRNAGYRPLPLSWDAAEHATRLPLYHKDPTDRMLIMAAQNAG